MGRIRGYIYAPSSKYAVTAATLSAERECTLAFNTCISILYLRDSSNADYTLGFEVSPLCSLWHWQTFSTDAEIPESSAGQ